MLHHLLVFPTVGLRPKGVDRRSFAPVQHSVLDAGFVSGNAHFAPKGIQFPDKVTLAGAADGGIAGQVGNCIHIDCKKDGAAAQTGGCQCRFNAGMSGTDHGNITSTCVIGGHNYSSSSVFLGAGGR